MMANGFFAAIGATLRAFGSRAGNEATDPTSVTWAHAAIAIAIMLATQISTQMLPVAMVAPQLLTELALPFAISIAVQVVPFAVLVACAIWTKQSARLPMVVMLTALGLIVIQLTALALSLASVRSDAALVGVMAYMTGRAARTMLGASIVGAIVAGLVVAVGVVAASLLFYALPGSEVAVAGAGAD
jgi:hypothetical protein